MRELDLHKAKTTDKSKQRMMQKMLNRKAFLNHLSTSLNLPKTQTLITTFSKKQLNISNMLPAS